MILRLRRTTSALPILIAAAILAGGAHVAHAQSGSDLPKDVSKWPEDWKYRYEERAGIMEYDGNMTRKAAEKAAEAEVRKAYATEQAGLEPPADPTKIRTGALTGNWKAVTKSSDGSRDVKLAFDGVNGEISLGGQVLKYKRTDAKDPTTKVKTSTFVATGSTAGMLHVDPSEAVETTVTLSLEDSGKMTGTYTIKRGGKTETGTISASRKVPLPKPYEPPVSDLKAAANFDPGPPAKLANYISTFPGDQLGLYTHDNAWVNFDPVWFRGRAGTGKARVLVVASDPGPDEAIVRRTLIGDAGKRVQGLLNKIGLTESYVLANAHPYAIFPSKAFDDGLSILDNPTLTSWRNKYYDMLIGSGENLQAIIVLGVQAQKAIDLWKDKPDVPVIVLPHPSNHDPVKTVASWKDAVAKLRKIITPDADGNQKGPNYGSNWSRDDYADIPRGDLPFGTARFVGLKDRANFASRPAGDVFRDGINVTVPYRGDVGGGILSEAGVNIADLVAKARTAKTPGVVERAGTPRTRTGGLDGVLTERLKDPTKKGTEADDR